MAEIADGADADGMLSFASMMSDERNVLTDDYDTFAERFLHGEERRVDE